MIQSNIEWTDFISCNNTFHSIDMIYKIVSYTRCYILYSILYEPLPSYRLVNSACVRFVSWATYCMSQKKSSESTDRDALPRSRYWSERVFFIHFYTLTHLAAEVCRACKKRVKIFLHTPPGWGNYFLHTDIFYTLFTDALILSQRGSHACKKSVKSV